MKKKKSKTHFNCIGPNEAHAMISWSMLKPFRVLGFSCPTRFQAFPRGLGLSCPTSVQPFLLCSQPSPSPKVLLQYPISNSHSIKCRICKIQLFGWREKKRGKWKRILMNRGTSLSGALGYRKSMFLSVLFDLGFHFNFN